MRRLLILYGSQSGTAQEVAERVGREGRRIHYVTDVKAMDEYDVRQLPTEERVVFVASTTGQGDEPDNMKSFWKFLLRKNLPGDSLKSLQFGVLALGDSSYQKYNYVGKKLYRRLLQLGGTSCQPLGLCDEQHDLGHDFVIDPWLGALWNILLRMDPLPPGLDIVDSTVLPPSKYIVDMNTKKQGDEILETNPIFNKENPYYASVTKCERVTSENHFQDTRLIELNIDNSGIVTRPGDVCNVQPENSEENVDFFFRIFPQFERTNNISLRQNPETNIKLPSERQYGTLLTIEDYVRKYLDIQGIPRRYFFELLSHFTKDELEKEKFREFNSAGGQQDLYEYCNRPRRNILETLYDFQLHTVPNIPFDYLFDLIPPIKPRSFSIASPGSDSKIEILVAVVRYKSSLVEPRKGLCSTWLSRLTPLNDEIPIWITSGTFKFPNESIPKIMVGPGTGIAPFRSYLLSNSSSPLPVALFFGCRGESKDYYFEKDWAYLKKCKDFSFHVAFSRDTESKVYVQHLIKKEKERVKDIILEKNGFFFIAGNAKQMPDQVRDALKYVLDECGVEDPEEYVKTMELKNRFQTETWS
ncbi:NADPH-dependent diflavin oxidoreductase 1 [Lepeophtheirus salmonis]|uniref:NADPH-dependent diflavin oxidoreductase 1 n=1 Tax=Lepeophtheirus salmonis TaxID=72036 RepID=A0A0K2UVB6_LEPSM|nr:NADPH-dependent diflavin oxidoreductase 1-like [Lepeophtheirus salmonis]XP_040575342.1 NADPH-dependent diflavin oxidoreductase 1-like [Lepeophtheirus salmonis]